MSDPVWVDVCLGDREVSGELTGREVAGQASCGWI